MPFTISHAAAAVPFRRTKLLLSAVFIGCMAPDFEYFVHVGMFGREAHNIRGALELALPVTLITLVVFHSLLKRPLAGLLPRAVQERVVIEEFHFWPLRRLFMIVLSAVIGIATHLLWDSFTHYDGWAVEHITWLQQRSFVGPLHRAVPHFKLAQNFSTLFGLVVLAIWFMYWYRTQSRHGIPMHSLTAFGKFASVTIMLGVAAALAYLRAQWLAGPARLSGNFVGNGVVAFISICCLEVVVFSAVMRFRMRSWSED
jgi:hypothetical protein